MRGTGDTSSRPRILRPVWRPANVTIVPLLGFAASIAFIAVQISAGIAGNPGSRLTSNAPLLVGTAALLAAMTAVGCVRRRYPIGSFVGIVVLTAILIVLLQDRSLGATPLYFMAIALVAVRVSGALLALSLGLGVALDIAAGIESQVSASTAPPGTAGAWIEPAINILVTYGLLVAFGKFVAFSRSQARQSTVALASARRDHKARLEHAIESERRTMARELHDVAAHHLTAMIIQAKAADKLMATDPQHSQQLLRDVITSGQRTLDGLRQIVGILRFSSDEDAPPQPMIADIPDLAHESRHSLGTVHLEITEDIDNIDSAVQLTCYRIAQESLANAMRHAPGSDAAVRLARRNGLLYLSVTDTGHDGPAADDGQGLGIAGMRERTALLGGRLEAGPSDAGGWHVSAQLPVDGRIAP